jgi:hypothetical protein
MKKSLVFIIAFTCLLSVCTMAYGINHAMWTHGTSLQIETPNNFVSATPYGFYKALIGRSNTSSWVHFQIPTPLIVNDVRLKASSVLLNFKTSSSSAQVKAVHVYDGDTRIATFGNLNLYGNVGMVRFTLSNAPLIYEGLNISVLTSFDAQSEIDFISAGCDFY